MTLNDHQASEDGAAIALDGARAARIAAVEALAQVEARRQAASRELEQAEADTEAASVDLAGPPGVAEAAEAKLMDAIKRAAEARGRYEVLASHALPAARRRLDEASEAEIHASRRLTYEAAKRHRDAAADTLASEYPRIGARLVKLVTTVAEACRAVSKANADLPAGCARLDDPEAIVRDRPGAAETVLIVRQEKRWTFKTTGMPLDDASARRVRQTAEGTGVLPSQAIMDLQGADVELRDFEVETYHPAQSPRCAQRLSTLSFPGLYPDTYYLQPQNDVFASADRAVVGRPEAHKAEVERPMLTRTKLINPNNR